MLTRSDLEFLSIFYYLKEGILGREFVQDVQNEPLGYDSKLYNNQQRTDYLIVTSGSAFGELATSRGRGWTSFEPKELNPCQIYNADLDKYVSTYNTPFFNQSLITPTEREENLIKVYDQFGTLMDRTWYQIDYDKGRVRFPAPTTPSGVVISGLRPATIDYRFHLVSTVEGWPTNDDIPALPVVAIYPTSELVTGYQLGGGVEFSRSYAIDIFATSTSNRRELIDFIKQGLYNKKAPTIDFNRCGYPLNSWGTMNNKFIQDLEVNGSTYRSYLTLNNGNGNILYFLNIEVSYDTSPRNSMSESTRHMGKIRFTTCSYSDRDPELVGKFSGLNEPVGGFDSLVTKAYTA